MIEPKQAPESEIQAEIRVQLSRMGYIVFRMQSGLYRAPDSEKRIRIGIKGMSDLLCISPTGQSVWIETKRSKIAKKSEEQENFINTMRNQGCKAGFCNSVEDAFDIIRTPAQRQ